MRNQALALATPETSIMPMNFLSEEVITEERIFGMLRSQSTTIQGRNNANLELVEHVCTKLPFKNVAIMELLRGSIEPAVIATQFLKKVFSPQLGKYGTSYSISLDPDSAGKEKIDETAAISRKSGVIGQAESLETEFRRLQGLRKVFALMKKNDQLTDATFAIPMSNLFETFLAEPVWFMSGEESAFEKSHRVCKLFKSEKEAHVFQTYNCGVRPLDSFDGKEEIPIGIMEIMAEAMNVFDFLVVTTPYRDLASKYWDEGLREPRVWVDPEVFGFMNDKPFLIRLGRWSSNGFLANKCDQIAETITHMHENFDHIQSFMSSLDRGSDINWYGSLWNKYHTYGYIDLHQDSGPIDAIRETLEYFHPCVATAEKNEGVFPKWLLGLFRLSL